MTKVALSGGSRGELFQDELEESVMRRNWGGEVVEGLGDLEYASKRSGGSGEVARESRESASSLIGQLDKSMGEVSWPQCYHSWLWQHCIILLLSCHP